MTTTAGSARHRLASTFAAAPVAAAVLFTSAAAADPADAFALNQAALTAARPGAMTQAILSFDRTCPITRAPYCTIHWKSVVKGKRESVRFELSGCRIIKTKHKSNN